MAEVPLNIEQRGASYFMKLCQNYGWRTISPQDHPPHDLAPRPG